MTKTIYGMALALVLGTTYALGDAGGEGNNTGCNGQGNPNSPCQSSGGGGGAGGHGGSGGAGGQGGAGGSGGSALQGQVQGQIQAQGQIGINRNRNDVSSNSNASAGSSSASRSNSNSVSNATGGAAVSGGNTQDVTVDASDKGVYSYHYENDYAASSAASVYGDVCTGGMSGQVEEGGFAVTNPNAFCNYMAAAMIYRDAFEWEMTYNVSEDCMDPMEGVGFESAEQYYDYCANPKAKELLENYYSNLENANEYMEMVEIPAKVDGIFGYLVRPIGVIAVLILLL